MSAPQDGGAWTDGTPSAPKPAPPRAKPLDSTDGRLPAERDCWVDSTWPGFRREMDYRPKPERPSTKRLTLRGLWRAIYWAALAVGALMVVAFLVAIAGLLFGGGSHGKARAALDALKRIEARTEMGVTWSDYNRVLGEQYAEIKPFLESDDARALPQVAGKIREAVECYKHAQFHWGLKIEFPTISHVGDDAEMQRSWRDASAAIREAERELR